MAGTLGNLMYMIKTSNKKFKRDMSENKREIKEFDREVDKSKKGLNDWSGKAKMAGAALTTFGVLVAGVSIKLARMSSAAGEVDSRFNHVFGNLSKEAGKWSKDFADDFEQVETNVQSWMASLQDTLVPMGVFENKAFEMSKALTALVPDFSSFYDMPHEQVFNKIISGIRGESEAVKEFGVDITEAALKQEALLQGWIKEGEELSRVQKIYARFNVIQKQTVKAQGDFMRTLESTANQERTIANLMTEIGEDLGEEIEPTYKSILGIIKSLLKQFKELPQPIKSTAVQTTLFAGGLALIVGPLALIVGYLPQLAAGLKMVSTSFAPFLISGVIVTGLIAIYNYLKNIRGEVVEISKIGTLEKAQEELENTQESITNLEDSLNKLKEKLAEYTKYQSKAEGPWSIFDTKVRRSEEQIASIESKLKNEREREKELEALIKKFNEEDSGGDSIVIDNGGGPDLDKEQLKELIEGYKVKLNPKFEDDQLNSIWEQWRLAREEVKSLGASEEQLGIVDEYWYEEWRKVFIAQKEEELAIEKEYQNKLNIVGKEGLEYELELINQEEEAALKANEGKEKAMDDIKAYYHARRIQAEEKYNEQLIAKQETFNETLHKLKMSDYLYERMKLQQRYNEYSKVIEDEKDLEEWFRIELENLDKKYDAKKQAREMKKYKFQLKNLEISNQEYINYLEKQLSAEEEHTDSWYALMDEKQSTIKNMVNDEIQGYIEESNKMYNNEEDRINWLISMLEELAKKYNDNKVILELINEEIKDLKDNLPEPEDLPPLADWLDEIGFSTKDALDIFIKLRTGLIDGLTDAITKGENFLDTLKNIADQIAQMMVQKGIVEPFIDFMFTSLFPKAHTGAVVTTTGLAQDLPSYHTGGKIPGLNSDERMIKVLTGERILSRGQNNAFESGLMRPQVNVEVVNNTGTPVQTRKEVKFDGTRTVVRLFMEGYSKNMEGIQDVFKGR